MDYMSFVKGKEKGHFWPFNLDKFASVRCLTQAFRNFSFSMQQ